MQRAKETFACRISRWLPTFSTQNSIRKKAPKFTALSGDVEFKIATTNEEFTQAFHLLYQGTLESGDTYDKSRLHLTKYHALPGSIILIALKNKEVLATATLIPDTFMGLPIENLCDISPLRKKSLLLYEIAELVVHPSLFKKRESLILPLIRFAYEVAQKYLKTDTLLIAPLKKRAAFYQAFFFFKTIPSKTPKQESSFQPLYTHLNYEGLCQKHHALAKKRRSNERVERFFYSEAPQFFFPKKVSSRTDFGRMSPPLLDYFFNEKTNVGKKMTILEKINLERVYADKTYLNIFAKNLVELESNRKFVRFNVACPATTDFTQDDKTAKIVVTDVSKKGLRISSNGLSFSRDKPLTLQVKTSPDESVVIIGQVVWQDRFSRHGLEIVEHSLPWFYFIENLQNSLKAPT